MANLFESETQKVLTELTDQKEEYLKSVMATLGVTLEHFIKYYILEEYPMEFEHTNDRLSDDFRFRITTKYRVRLKTKEELELEDGQRDPQLSSDDPSEDNR